VLTGKAGGDGDQREGCGGLVGRQHVGRDNMLGATTMTNHTMKSPQVGSVPC